MKNTFTLIFLFIFLSSVNGQNQYSSENLQKANEEELQELLLKAQKQKKVGTVMSIAGPASTVTGLLLWNAAWSGSTAGSATLGGVMMIGGAITTIVGVLIMINGSSAVKRINEIISTNSSTIKLDLKPSAHYNLITQNYQPVITLCLRF